MTLLQSFISLFTIIDNQLSIRGCSKGRVLLLFVNVSFFGVHAYAQGEAELGTYGCRRNKISYTVE